MFRCPGRTEHARIRLVTGQIRQGDYLSKVLGVNGIQQAFNVGALLPPAMNWTWRVGQGNQLHGQH